jgi:hypothetical protein
MSGQVSSLVSWDIIFVLFATDQNTKGIKIMKTYDTVNTGKLKTEQNITDMKERERGTEG